MKAVLGRIFRLNRGHDDLPVEPAPGGTLQAMLPIFPTRDEVVTSAFVARRVRTAHGTLLAASSGVLVHEHDPSLEREVTLFRSNVMPEIGILAAHHNFDLYDGSLVAPFLPVLVLNQPNPGQVALRSAIREAHICALQPEGNPLPGQTDFYRNWIGPWELFSLERRPAPILSKEAEAALAHIGRLLESGIDPGAVTSWLAGAPPSAFDVPRALAMQVAVHLLSRPREAAAQAHSNDERNADVRLRAREAPSIYAPVHGPLHVAGEIRPQTGVVQDPRLRGTWTTDQHGRCFATGSRVLANFTLPCRPMHAQLQLDIRASDRPILMTVSVNGWQLGKAALGSWKAPGSRLVYWIPKEAVTSGTLSVAFDFDPPAPPHEAHAFVLTALTLHVGPPIAEITPPEDAGALMKLFESLGEDCEFGFVQRYFGIDPMGIFRFAGFGHLYNLVTMLQSDFEGLGAPGSLIATDVIARIYRDPEPILSFPEYFMCDEKLGLGYHTWKGPQDLSREAAVLENERKMTYLRRKFIEDLEDAEKIWLFKDTRREDFNKALAIYDLLGRHGPNKLFWVTRTTPGRPSGAVEWVGPRLLRGYSDQPHVDAQRFDPAAWLELCQNAYRAFAEGR